MVHLRMEHVVDVEHELGKHPIVGFVKRGINEILSGVGLDSQGQEVLRLRMDEEVSRASGAISLGSDLGLSISGLALV